MSMILVSPLAAVDEVLKAYAPSHIVSLLSPPHMIETPEGFPRERHLRLGLNDISDPAFGDAPPDIRHVDDLLAFGRAWSGERPLLSHCWAGVSRSMAAAYILLCDRAGTGSEHEIAQTIREKAPHAYPNRLLIRLADMRLERQGRMVRAVEAMGPGTPVEEGVTVEFPLILAAK